MAEYNDIEIPENADKFLFAEDLMRNVMLRKGSSVPHFTCRAGPYREFVYNGFNETTGMAVWFLYHGMAYTYFRVFRYMQNRNIVTHEMHAKIANVIIARHFSAGFHADRFLLFSVHMAILAAYFYTNGFLEAPDLAVLYIVMPLLGIDMTTGGWDTLNSSAQRYANMTRDLVNTLSPES